MTQTDHRGPEVDALVEALAREGTVDSEGEFTVDLSRARELLEGFRLADPGSWAAELIPAAVLLGATRFEAEVDARRVSVSFDGAALERVDLERIDDLLLTRSESARPRALSQLTVAISGATASSAREIRVVSGGASGGFELIRRPGAPDRVVATDGPLAGTRVLVTRTVPPEQPDGVAPPEARRLETLGRHASLEIVLNGRPVAGGMTLPDAACAQDVAGDGFAGVALLAPGATRPALRLVQHGLVIAEEEVEGAFRGLQVIVEVPRAQRDLSLGRVVQDERLEGVRQAARESVSRIRGAAIQRLDTASDAELRLLRAALRSAFLEGSAPELPALGTLPLWPVLVGEGGLAHVSYEDLADGPRLRSDLCFTTLSPLQVEPVILESLDPSFQVLQVEEAAEARSVATRLRRQCHDLDTVLSTRPPPSRLRRLGWWLRAYGVVWICGLGTLGFLLAMYSTCSEGCDQRRWPKVSAEVEEVSWKAKWDNKKGKNSYEVNVRLRYQVKGITYHYRGDQALSYPDSRAAADEKVAEVKRSGRVVLYYQPDRPGRATLRRAAPGESCLMITPFLVFLGFTVVTWLGGPSALAERYADERKARLERFWGALREIRRQGETTRPAAAKARGGQGGRKRRRRGARRQGRST